MKCVVSDLAIFGGVPLFASVRSTSNLQSPCPEKFFSYAGKIFCSRRLTNNGPLVQLLEERLAALHGVRHCIAVCSGFMGLLIAVHALARPGLKRVLLPTMTYRRLDDAVRWAGLVPDFCDAGMDTLAVDPADMRGRIGAETALLLPVHPISNLCDIESFVELGREYDLPVLFDSVEASYASHKGNMVGSFGDAEVFSLHASKLINGFEGGYVTTHNAGLAERLRRIRAFGFQGQDNVVELGLNAKLNEVHAAMALACLDGLEEQVELNMRKHLLYQRLLADMPGLSIVSYAKDERRGWKNVLLRLGPGWPVSRASTIRVMHAENMLARPYYADLLHKKYGAPGESAFPVAERLCREYLLMPSGAFVLMEDIERIAEFMHFLQDHGADIDKRLAGGATA